MGCVSKWFIIGNSATLLFGLYETIAGLYFLIHRGSGTQCQHYSQTAPLLIPGAFLALVSIFGLVGVCKKNNTVMLAYLTGMLFLILGITGYTMFLWYGYKNEDYASWKNWDSIKTCLAEDVLSCKSLENRPSFQSGCCKPPSNCGFRMKNETFWEVPASGPAAAYNIPDCRKWSNNRDKLCWDCNSCKAGYLEILKTASEFMLIYDICQIVALLGVFSIGWCAWRRNTRDGLNYEGVA